MNLFRLLVGRVLGCVVLPVAVASGQRITSPTFDLAAQAWKGGSSSRVFADDGGLALDAVATWRAREFGYGALLVGAGGAWQGRFMESDGRCVHPPGGIGSVCTPDFPSLSSFNVLGGVEGTFGRSSPTLRALAGPAVFFGQSHGAILGLEGRAVLSTPSIFHVALVFTARGAIIPRYDGEQHQMGALGMGLRIQ